MSRGPTSVLVDANDRPAVAESLIGLGFEFEPEADTVVTMLDTFDGRLHRAGLRLALLEADGLALEFTDPGHATLRTPIRTAPRFAADLPGDALRSTITELIGVRPLLPRLRLQASRARAARLDDEGHVTAEIVVAHGIAVDGGNEEMLPTTTSIVEIRALDGSPKPSRRAVKALVRLALDPIEGDWFDVIADHAGIGLEGCARPAEVRLDPNASAVSGVQDVLTNLATSIEANWQGTIDDSDADFLHDLRVAVRRTRSIITQTKTVLPRHVVVEAGDWFTWLSNLTGPARDLDVYVIEWDDYAQPLGAEAISALEPVRTVLVRRQQAAHDALSEALATPAADEMKTRWHRTLAELPTRKQQGARARHTLGSVVHQRISIAQTTLIERGRLIQPDTPAEQVHDLRKDAKRLRYLLECFASILADGPRKKFVKRLKALQDNLGTHQDAEVHVALLREIADELGPQGSAATAVALEQLTERLERIRLTSRAKFAERFAAYDTEVTMLAFDDMLEGLAT